MPSVRSNKTLSMIGVAKKLVVLGSHEGEFADRPLRISIMRSTLKAVVCNLNPARKSGHFTSATSILSSISPHSRARPVPYDHAAAWATRGPLTERPHFLSFSGGARY